MLKMATALGLTVAIAGCSQEAGHRVDGGTFGNATLNNVLIMNGDRSYTIGLANRFAAEVPSMVNFAFDSVVLDGEARAALDLQANWIRQFPEIRFRVYGHTDAVGSSAYNRRLGKRRANAVVRYLSARGISRSRLEAVASFGETKPPHRDRGYRLCEASSNPSGWQIRASYLPRVRRKRHAGFRTVREHQRLCHRTIIRYSGYRRSIPYNWGFLAQLLPNLPVILASMGDVRSNLGRTQAKAGRSNRG
jgi:hypothetical protein